MTDPDSSVIASHCQLRIIKTSLENSILQNFVEVTIHQDQIEFRILHRELRGSGRPYGGLPERVSPDCVVLTKSTSGNVDGRGRTIFCQTHDRAT
jgi:hypothetical protein